MKEELDSIGFVWDPDDWEEIKRKALDPIPVEVSQHCPPDESQGVKDDADCGRRENNTTTPGDNAMASGRVQSVSVRKMLPEPAIPTEDKTSLSGWPSQQSTSRVHVISPTRSPEPKQNESWASHGQSMTDGGTRIGKENIASTSNEFQGAGNHPIINQQVRSLFLLQQHQDYPHQGKAILMIPLLFRGTILVLKPIILVPFF